MREQTPSERVELYPKTFWRENLESISIAIMCAVFIMVYVVQACMVEGYSMEPTLHNKQRLFIEKVMYRITSPRIGDIVVLHPPSNPNKRYIKRVIGIPGDYVEIKDNKVYINNKPLEEKYIMEPLFSADNFTAQVIPEGKYLVLGDNRRNSQDGRSFGLIDKKAIVGRALLVFWPLKEFKIIRRPKYKS